MGKNQTRSIIENCPQNIFYFGAKSRKIDFFVTSLFPSKVLEIFQNVLFDMFRPCLEAFHANSSVSKLICYFGGIGEKIKF